MKKKEFVVESLELHLFFIRIMKEHAIFLEIGFLSNAQDKVTKAKVFKEKLEQILVETIKLSDGFISEKILKSKELVTNFTLESEINTKILTGVDINTNITRKELCLKEYDLYQKITEEKTREVEKLNEKILFLLEEFILFKNNIREDVRIGALFTFNYMLFIEHLLKEALLYRKLLLAIEIGCHHKHPNQETELFWNKMMMEHSLFIRGLLDPTEEALIKEAGEFKEIFKELTKHTQNIDDIKMKTLESTKKLRIFKEESTIGINEHEIKSLMLPLLTDHVLREANHYIRLLSDEKR